MEIENMLYKLFNRVDVKEIVNERLEYLRSAEYQNRQCHIISQTNVINRDRSTYQHQQINEGSLAKWQGFIPETFKISSKDAIDSYISSETDIYEEYLLYLKKMIEKGEITVRKAITAKPVIFVQNYFWKERNSEYKELVEGMREEGWSASDIRFYMRDYIQGYKANKDRFTNFEDYINFCNKVERLKSEGKNSQTNPIIKEFYNLKSGICSIGDLKGLGFGPAQCTEMATCVQNLFSFIGFDTYILIGRREKDGRKGPHNFNVINENGKWSLVDSSNSTIFFHLKDDFDIDSFIHGDYVMTDGKAKYYSYDKGLSNVDISSPKVQKRQ